MVEPNSKYSDGAFLKKFKSIHKSVRAERKSELAKCIKRNRILIQNDFNEAEKAVKGTWSHAPPPIFKNTKMKYVTIGTTYSDKNQELTSISLLPLIKIQPVKTIPPTSTWLYTPKNYIVRDDEETHHCPYIDELTFVNDPAFINDLEDLYTNENEVTDVGDEAIFYNTLARITDFEKQEKRTITEKVGDDLWAQMMRETTVPRSNTPASIFPKYKYKPSLPEDLFTPSEKSFNIFSQIITSAPPKKLKEKFVSLLKKRHPILSDLHTPGPNLDNPLNIHSYEANVALDSYRQMFCRKCYLFNCPFHTSDGIATKYITKKTKEPASLGSPCSDNCFQREVTTSIGKHKHTKSPEKLPDYEEVNMDGWEPNDISLCHVLLEVYPESTSYCIIANILKKECHKVNQYIRSLKSKLKLEKNTIKSVAVNLPISGSRVRKFTTKCLQNQDLSSSDSISTIYKPCFHPGQSCDSSRCSCIESKYPCEKYCTCDPECIHRVLGCSCEEKCGTKFCPCFANQRECDPDLCRTCGASFHEEGFITCRNVGIQRQWKKHLKLKESQIPNAGWGIFSVQDIWKGEFISEYVGELISDYEADRRSLEYQKKCHTFVFELNSELSVDAYRKGSKIRFANHADRPNCYVKIMKVNTDHRIGVYAARDISSGDELFLDYRKVIDEHMAIKAKEKIPKRKRVPSKSVFPYDWMDEN